MGLSSGFFIVLKITVIRRIQQTHKTGSLPSPKLKNLNFYRVKYRGWYSQKFCVCFSGVLSFGSGDEQFHDSLHSRRTSLPRAK
jgi:hypothetical protein